MGNGVYVLAKKVYIQKEIYCIKIKFISHY